MGGFYPLLETSTSTPLDKTGPSKNKRWHGSCIFKPDVCYEKGVIREEKLFDRN
jgi:hypothetical protein